MPTIADMRISTTECVLGPTFSRRSDLTCELEQVILGERFGMWFAGAGRSHIERALERDGSVTGFEFLSAVDDRHLYSVRFADPDETLFAVAVDCGGTVMAASASDRHWRLQVRAPRREMVSQLYDALADRGHTVDVVRLYNLTEDCADSLGLTPEQYRAIVEATEHGYFEIPREISLEDLADELDISHQALSERLRRAYQTLATKELDSSDERPSRELRANLR